MLITPKSSNEFPWISIWRLVKPHANYCVDIVKALWLRPAFAESYRLLRVTLLWLFMFDMHLISGITDGWQGCKPPHPAKLNVKNGPPPYLYFGIYYSFDFSRLLCFCVFRSIFGYLGLLCSHSIPGLLLFFNNFLSVSANFPHGSNL